MVERLKIILFGVIVVIKLSVGKHLKKGRKRRGCSPSPAVVR